MKAVAVLAVLPDYRSSFVQELYKALGQSDTDLSFVVGDQHLDATVKSADHPRVIKVRNRTFLGRRILWQAGALRHVHGADVVVVDLNPRSVTAWVILLWRMALRRRTLVWGHILPRRGAAARTAPLRRRMRRLASGVISYTWSDAQKVIQEDKSARVWVAANGLYPDPLLGYDAQSDLRHRLLYVGRIEPTKKPILALQAFAIARRELSLDDRVRLTFVGSGSQSSELETQARAFSVSDRVDVLGSINDYERLRKLYAESVASLSPGYVGLSLTQSLGFGVPMLVARDEPHAPEFELFSASTGRSFPMDDSRAMAEEMVWLSKNMDSWDRTAIVATVRETYSSTAMARGFELALRNIDQPVAK
ncbi:glycosyltransferase [Labedella populi]|uniref:Glycosyltransferase n=1 Tax=Labedella populi TaxID=2498850 RepID=A0A444QGC8_9MICO|nr:glycosyltransferase [Labedella populi]RWZ68641.1 glycosyltransferase [Labedella populi]